MEVLPPSSLERVFDWVAQEDFSRLSGDSNPMHMNAIAARRTIAGQPVVHGVHALLWALETLAHKGQLRFPVAHIKVRFQKLIYVGDAVAIKTVRHDDGGLVLQLCVDDLVVSLINIGFGEPSSVNQGEEASGTVPLPEWPTEPIDCSFNELEHASGWLAFAQDTEAATRSFPCLAAAIGVSRVSALACMSRLVGMVCPGLHSMFFSLNIYAIQLLGSRHALRYEVTSVHDQFRLVRETIEGGGWSGTVESIACIPPVAQPTVENLAGLVPNGEFRQTNALIIGGSRGLGELTAKLIVAGGGAVTITYARGVDDALEVQNQIRAWGGRCEVLRYDATLAADSQFAQLGSAFTSLYYFATKPISHQSARLFTFTIFEDFNRVYTQGFFDACSWFFHKSLPEPSVFYPSSVFVDDHPPGMTEYAMAKAAGEILCGDLARSHTGCRFIVERLPRMLTDQTASVMPSKMGAPIEIMLPIVRRVEARAAS